MNNVISCNTRNIQAHSLCIKIQKSIQKIDSFQALISIIERLEQS